MSTFSPAKSPTVGTSYSRKGSARVVSFGDGYEQRVSSGGNAKRITATLSWEGLTFSEARTIADDLSDGMGYSRREYRLPFETATRNWVVEEVSFDTSDNLVAAVEAKLREVFEI